MAKGQFVTIGLRISDCVAPDEPVLYYNFDIFAILAI